MWQTKEHANQPNENLKNSLEKQVIYKSFCTNGSTLRLTQLLSETILSFDIPNYFLNLWINYFKDSADAVDELIKHAESSNDFDAGNLLYKSLNDNGKLLRRRLRDYESILDYYVISNHTFAKGSEKFRRSTLKNVENLKFLPINLHLEKFIVEESQSISSKSTKVYEFTSVGAFTTAHTNKQTIQKPIELVMMNDEPFDFNENIQISRLMNNEILLVFYSLKLLIRISESLKGIRQKPGYESFIAAIIPLSELENYLDTLYKFLIPSYEKYANDLAMSVKIEKKQFYYNISERLKYFRVKFEAFIIEIKNMTSNSQLDNYFIDKITTTIIEFYQTIIIEAIPDKFDFVNNCASFSQAITSLIASVDFKFYKNEKISSEEKSKLLDFYLTNGLLFQVESMLSCFSSEILMIYDHVAAIKCLETVIIHLPTNDLSLLDQNFSIHVNIEIDGFHVYMYTPIDTNLKGFRVFPLIVNVGINEQALSSGLLGNNLIQKFVNTQSIIKLKKYYDNAKIKPELQPRLNSLFYQLRTNKTLVDDSRPVELLHYFAEITRLLNGVRVTNCKSGKDRTGVSVSLEQCMILLREHNLSVDARQFVLDDFRRFGTRLDIARKNVGSSRYAFNKIRYFLLPQLYRPPLDLCDELET